MFCDTVIDETGSQTNALPGLETKKARITFWVARVPRLTEVWKPPLLVLNTLDRNATPIMVVA
jgi:hypothetical protein